MNKTFKILGWLEGLSFLLLLFLAMPLKYYANIPQAVKVLGPVHGALFLLYCSCAFMLSQSNEWPVKKQLLAYLAAVFPFGTFLFDRKYL